MTRTALSHAIAAAAALAVLAVVNAGFAHDLITDHRTAGQAFAAVVGFNALMALPLAEGVRRLVRLLTTSVEA